MKTKKEIQKKIDEIMQDERLHYPPANVKVNAPLALIQVDLKAKLATLHWMLDAK